MTSEYWDDVYTLFNAAVDLPLEERFEFLSASAAHTTVRREVERLLDVYDARPDYLEIPAVHVTALSGCDPDPIRLDERVGPYRLLHRLGAGGMGAVFLAVRDDDQYRKEVAVKLVKRGMDTEEILRRFRAERQILASLEHPNIARLLDGGMTDDGRPYVVMEYVDGISLHQYCEKRRLRIRERLELFRTVCDTVQFAHQNLIVHRDLKPSNILVTDSGQAKLLDFGIAKLLDTDRSVVTLPVTRTDVRLMTPDYASPEQARGIPVNTTSDVYQLGVLLYQLVTGRRPYDLRDQGTEEVIRIICEVDPEKPSVAVRSPVGDGKPLADATRIWDVDPERLSRLLAGDLDTIVLKAMHKEPARRYASAEALADDVSHHLDGRPVLARPDTVGYRVGKFVRRNRLGVGMAAVLALLLIGFGTVTAWQARALAVERDAARAERDKAEQAVQVLVDLFETSDPTVVPGGDTLRVGTFLERGESRMFEALADQPDVQANMKSVVGRMYAARSQFDRARMLLEEAAVEQVALGGPDHPDVLQALHDLAVLARRTDRPEAETLLRESLERQRIRYGRRHENVAQALDDLSIAVEDEQERAALLEEALSIRREELPAVSDGIASSLSNLAALRYSQKDFDEAVRLWQQTLDMLLDLHDESNPRVLTVIQSLAAAYGAQGRVEEAETLRRRALALAREVIGPETDAVAVNLSNLGVLLTQKGDFAEAEAAFRDALSVWRSIFREDHWRTANDLRNLGIVLQYQGRADEGLPYLADALAVNRRLHGADSPQAGYVLGQHAVLLLHLGRTEQALTELRTALKLVETSSAADARAAVADTRFRLGHVLLEAGSPDEAEALFREVLATRNTLFPANHPRLSEVQCGLGLSLVEGDARASGTAILVEAVPRYASWGQADRLLLARARRALGGPAQE